MYTRVNSITDSYPGITSRVSFQNTDIYPSKTFNIAGQRTGNMIIPDPELRAAMKQRLLCSVNNRTTVSATSTKTMPVCVVRRSLRRMAIRLKQTCCSAQSR